MPKFTDRLIQTDFPTFCRKAHKEIRNGEVLDDDGYLKPVLAFADDIASGAVTRGIINLPPGTAKSFIFSVCLSAWTLAHDPAASIMIVCHGKKNSKDIARKILRVMKAPFFTRNFNTRIDIAWKGAGDFGTTKAGAVYATSIKGAITGYRADLIIVDDPLSIKNADNEAEIELVNKTFDLEIVSRIRNNNSRIVIAMHRLNENDLTAHVLKKKLA